MVRDLNSSNIDPDLFFLLFSEPRKRKESCVWTKRDNRQTSVHGCLSIPSPAPQEGLFYLGWPEGHIELVAYNNLLLQTQPH